MKTIQKYVVHVRDTLIVELPASATIKGVGVQQVTGEDGKAVLLPMCFVEADMTQPVINRTFVWVPTGGTLPIGDSHWFGWLPYGDTEIHLYELVGVSLDLSMIKPSTNGHGKKVLV